MSQRADEITALLAPATASLGLELLGVEWAPSSSRSLLRLYIDAPGRAVTLEDCEAVSREVEAVLDVHDPIKGRYTLEVSSPGLDRPLFTAAQFERHLGEQVRLTLALPVDGRRRLSGRIVAVEGGTVVLAAAEGEVRIDSGVIEMARIVPDFAALGIGPASARGGRRGTGKR
ncbi:MAG TPA: ribosome maturation factor RimP [Xanthomonadaceae bacterium]|nr:ribosome maturation factor RimP [Xanthomonadaceae bacterium]